MSGNRGKGSTRKDIDKLIARVAKERQELDARPFEERIKALRESQSSEPKPQYTPPSFYPWPGDH
jgi:hypothetical protein